MNEPVLVTWVDSSSRGAWQPTEDAKKWAREHNLLCETAGLLLEATEDRLTLVQSRSKDGELIDDPMIIPREAVVSIKWLR